MVDFGRDLWRLSSPIPYPLMQGCPQQVAQDHMQVDFEDLQGGRNVMTGTSWSSVKGKAKPCSLEEITSCTSICWGQLARIQICKKALGSLDEYQVGHKPTMCHCDNESQQPPGLH